MLRIIDHSRLILYVYKCQMSIDYSCSEDGLNTLGVRLFRDKPARTILVVCIVMTVTVVRGRYRIVLLFISHISHISI